MKLKNRVALRIRTIRKRRGLTQEKLAEKIGRTGDAVSQLERALSLPSFSTLEQLASALDVPVRDFFDIDKGEEAGPHRSKLMAVLLDICRNMSDRDLQVAVQVLEVIGPSKRPGRN